MLFDQVFKFPLVKVVELVLAHLGDVRFPISSTWWHYPLQLGPLFAPVLVSDDFTDDLGPFGVVKIELEELAGFENDAAG